MVEYIWFRTTLCGRMCTTVSNVELCRPKYRIGRHIKAGAYSFLYFYKKESIQFLSFTFTANKKKEILKKKKYFSFLKNKIADMRQGYFLFYFVGSRLHLFFLHLYIFKMIRQCRPPNKSPVYIKMCADRW